MADISAFFRDIERAKYYDAIINDLPFKKNGGLVSKYEGHMLKVSRGEIADCWRDIVYKFGACERFPNKTREYMKNFDKFGGFTNNQIKIIIFMLRTMTEDLDDAMEVLLQKVYFLLQRIYLVFHLKKPNNTCWMDGLLMSEELYQHFESKVGRIEVFLMFSFCIIFV